MILNVLDNNRDLLDIVDYAIEILWTKKYYDIGGCVFRVPASNELVDLFVYKAKYITRDDDDMVCLITKITLSQNIDTGADELTITCLSISQLLTQRIVWEQLNLNYSVDICMRFLVDRNFINTSDERVISFIKLGSLTSYGSTIQRQFTEEYNVFTAIQELALTYNIGFKFIMNENKDFVFTLYRGTDRSINQTVVDPVEFNPGLHNLASFSYELDLSNEKNVALVLGEGEGLNRKKVVVGSITGINRKEITVDDSSASSNDGEITNYNDLLIETGTNILSENAVTEHFNFEIDADSYIYKEDFDLGDTITIQGDYGLSLTAKIVEVIETWYETNEYTVKINVEI